MTLGESLLCRTTESPHNKAVDGDIDGCVCEIQRSNDPECMSGLFQALLRQAAELPQPRLNERKQTFCLIDVDSVRRYVPLFVDDRSVIPTDLAVRLEYTCPDLSQRLGEVFSLLNHWLKIAFVVDPALSANHTK